MGLLEENGPCFVETDSKTTRLNPWSWNNEVNMLYIDQPTQVGFSYDVPTNSTLVLHDEWRRGFQPVPTNFSNGIPEVNLTHRVGTVSSQRPNNTANSTAYAAHAVWHFMQTWFFEFPHYKPHDNRISVWTESYGGHYGPGFFGFFQRQNEKIDNGTTTEKGAHRLHLDTLGIINGLIDYTTQAIYYLHYGYNNVRSPPPLPHSPAHLPQQTYSIPLYNQSTYESLLSSWTQPGGCTDKLLACRSHLLDNPNPTSPNPCTLFDTACAAPLDESFSASNQLNRSWYDIANPSADAFPPPHLHGYLTSSAVLSALGVPVNYTAASAMVGNAFDANFDIVRGDYLGDLAHLLDEGNVSVHLVYGDRDWACNWLGGEAAAFAVPWRRREEFVHVAGYAPLLVPMGKSKGKGEREEVKGMTRQVGRFSFSRVFQAGHEVPAYQPEAAYEVFMRAMTGRDVATGSVDITRPGEDVVTVGRNDTLAVRQKAPPVMAPRCYVLKPATCLEDVWETVRDGTARVEDFFVVGETEQEIGDL